ncbi:hypothetical protein BpHYR1_005150 [Brachionus plicatilis]|uniref:Uncharacterized protein n=1 Tax=Brachionus plicatilis TaxID=10195 RepID=A0A3M7SPA3_BRAPC|nr:hypothetical protein BpHYR1_005150 [Brachionus plicatilis]
MFDFIEKILNIKKGFKKIGHEIFIAEKIFCQVRIKNLIVSKRSDGCFGGVIFKWLKSTLLDLVHHF